MASPIHSHRSYPSARRANGSSSTSAGDRVVAELRSLSDCGGADAAKLTSMLAPFAGDNPFNPSARRYGARWYVAFRHFGARRTKPFEASLLVGGPSGVERTSLSDHAARFGARNVSDPKLLELRGELWVTFNDGWSRDGNALYLMPVTPELGRPILCRYGGARSVEKNWAFFDGGDDLGALYSIDPVHVIRAEWPRSGADTAVFRDSGGAPPPRAPLGLSIGTQIATDGGRTYVIAHEKWRFFTLRAYVGRLATVHDLQGAPRIEVSGRRLFHSVRSLAGERPRPNKNLLSCTYFCGLDVRDGVATLGYGINDVRVGFAQVDMTRL